MTDPQDWAAPGARPPGTGHPDSPPEQPGPGEPGHQNQGAPYPGTPGSPAVPPGPPWGDAAAAPKPGVIPLRPLGVGEILDGAVSYVRANPVATLGLAAIVTTITQLVELPLTGLALSQLTWTAPVPGESLPPTGAVTGLAGSLTSSGIAALVIFVATTVLSGMLIAVLSQSVLGRKMRIGEAWAAVRRRIPGLLGLTLLIALLLGLVLIAGGAPLVIFAVLDASTGVGLFLGVPFLLLSWAVALFLGVSWSLAAPAYVLEGISVTAALRRSFRLVRKQWWRVFGIVLLGGVIALIIGAVLSLPFGFAADAVGGSPDPADPFGAVSMSSLVISGIGTIVGTTVTAPFSAGISGLLYFDQRIRREALDIELARAAHR
jgi:hypothetical protein